MRILLIDNYDSFTWNLYQLIADVSDEPPLVIRNDEWSLREVLEAGFDRIVISPGPGSPTVAGDFGVCGDVLRQATCPVLGVCLGHQGLGHVFGARVTHAPHPMHGRTSEIFHSGRGIFRDVPSPFSAVRYHSLAVDALPPSLECTAWTEDGVVMGLQHRSRPLCGVQFHPESICTEHGATLIANFLEVDCHRPASAQRSGGTSKRREDATTRPSGTPQYRIVSRRLDWMCEPETAFHALFANQSPAFWLDSSRTGGALARFSFMGDAEGRHARVLRYSVRDEVITVSEHGSETSHRRDLFTQLQLELDEMQVDEPSPPLPFGFCFGLVGYIGYEVRPEIASRYSSLPDARFIRPSRMLAFDHQDKHVWLLSLVGSADEERSAHTWFDGVEQTLRSTGDSRAPCAPRPVPDTAASAMHLDIAAGAYIDRIGRCLSYIRDGEAYELCLTNKLRLPGSIDALTFYSALRRANPAPFAAFFRWPEMAIVCSSPECFLHITADGDIITKPIKGTARRKADPEQDARIREELRHDEKTRSENLMIVDLLRNDLGRVSATGSVRVPKLMDIETYATVHQMVSTVSGQLRGEATAVDCLAAAFPGGSMTGAPKLRAMTLLEDLECAPRGVYSGTIGWLSPNGSATFNIVIRTAIVTESEVSIGAGGAIVALSDPEEEFHETLIKLEPMVAAYAAATGVPVRSLLDRLWALADELQPIAVTYDWNKGGLDGVAATISHADRRS